ncbi:hypothetical protein AB0M87_06435 [Streptomyces sp. NPDC051320]|uniref:hypothetical protein n=1 Tax=Streptomyces sp. NPDC051320 TaxID=3154644 RepID=UPI003419A284
MKIMLRRSAATAVLTLAVALPLITAAQAAAVPTQKTATAHPNWGGHHEEGGEHNLLDLDLDIL